MNACPKCGGTSGWGRIAHVHATEETTWDLIAFDTDYFVVWKSSIVKCLNCGKRFKYHKLYRKDGNEIENENPQS